jgi:hypothetical protein
VTEGNRNKEETLLIDADANQWSRDRQTGNNYQTRKLKELCRKRVQYPREKLIDASSGEAESEAFSLTQHYKLFSSNFTNLLIS